MWDFHRQLLASLETERRLQAGLRRDSDDHKRVVDIYIDDKFGPINGTTAKVVADQLHAHPHADEVRVHISSGGGSLAATCDVMAALWGHVGRKVAMIRCAGSGAFLTALACDHLVAHPKALFLHHSPRVDGGKPLRFKSFSDITALLFKRQHVTSPHVLATLERWGNELRYFTADEAKGLNIIDAIEDFTPDTPGLDWMRATDAQDRRTDEGRARIAARLKPHRDRHERKVERMRAELAPVIAEYRAKRHAKLGASFKQLDDLARDDREPVIGYKMVGGRKMPIWGMQGPLPKGAF